MMYESRGNIFKRIICQTCFKMLSLNFLKNIEYSDVGLLIYPTKKKRNSKIFQLSSSFNGKMLIVIKHLFLIKSY